MALIALGLLTTLLTFHWQWLGWALLLVLAGAALAFIIDARTTTFYELGPDHLQLTADGRALAIPVSDLVDASIMDRTSARGYLRQWLMEHPPGNGSIARAERSMMRFCTVPVGRNLANAQGPRTTGSLHTQKEVVLLRTKGHGPLLLSPLSNRELRDAVLQRVLAQSGDKAPTRRASNDA